MTEAYTSLEKTVEFYDAGAHIPFNFKFITDVNSTSNADAFKKLIDEWTKAADKRNGTSNWVVSALILYFDNSLHNSAAVGTAHRTSIGTKSTSTDSACHFCQSLRLK